MEELVAKRVEEELEKRKDEIEREVLRRVEEAKRIMEKQLLEELERQRHAELAAQKAREVTLDRWKSKRQSMAKLSVTVNGHHLIVISKWNQSATVYPFSSSLQYHNIVFKFYFFSIIA